MRYVADENMRLPNLKLATVAEQFLPDQLGKIDLPFTKITAYWKESDARRTELCVYCERDAEIPIQLCVVLNAVYNVVERARVTHLPCDWITTRGTVCRFTRSVQLSCSSPSFSLAAAKLQLPRSA